MVIQQWSEYTPAKSGTAVNEFGSSSDFAPYDYSDGRQHGDWQMSYPQEARSKINREAIYLTALLFGVPFLILLISLEIPRTVFSIEPAKYQSLATYAYAWLGGTLGGTLFGVKWLYHCVAKRRWHLDRRLWRLFTPHISGALACVFVLFIASGFFKIFDRNALTSPSVPVSIGFLVGYFSDHASAKLSELAETLFGPVQKRRPSAPTKNEAYKGQGR